MPVFFVHDVGKGVVTPLSRKFRVREISPTEELTEVQAIHPKKETDFNEYLPEPAHKKPPERSNKLAAELYRETQSGDHLKLGKVKDIMSTPVLTAKKNQTLGEAWHMMQKYEIHHLAIVDENEALCGMLSEKVILPYLLNPAKKSQEQADPEYTTLSVFCRQTLLSTSPETLIKDLVPALLEYGLDGIAVTENGQLSGIATYSDILKVLLKMQVFEARA